MKPSPLFLLFVFLAIVSVELYFIQALKTVSQDYSPNKKKYILIAAYSLTALTIIFSAFATFFPPPEWNMFLRFILACLLIIFICKLIGSTFLLIDDFFKYSKISQIDDNGIFDKIYFSRICLDLLSEIIRCSKGDIDNTVEITSR